METSSDCRGLWQLADPIVDDEDLTDSRKKADKCWIL